MIMHRLGWTDYNYTTITKPKPQCYHCQCSLLPKEPYQIISTLTNWIHDGGWSFSSASSRRGKQKCHTHCLFWNKRPRFSFHGLTTTTQPQYYEVQGLHHTETERVGYLASLENVSSPLNWNQPRQKWPLVTTYYTEPFNNQLLPKNCDKYPFK